MFLIFVVITILFSLELDFREGWIAQRVHLYIWVLENIRLRAIVTLAQIFNETCKFLAGFLKMKWKKRKVNGYLWNSNFGKFLKRYKWKPLTHDCHYGALCTKIYIGIWFISYETLCQWQPWADIRNDKL